jgi:hypothetical protein
MIWTGCKSDCRYEYESEVESCKLMYDDPDDADCRSLDHFHFHYRIDFPNRVIFR